MKVQSVLHVPIPPRVGNKHTVEDLQCHISGYHIVLFM